MGKKTRKENRAWNSSRPGKFPDGITVRRLAVKTRPRSIGKNHRKGCSRGNSGRGTKKLRRTPSCRFVETGERKGPKKRKRVPEHRHFSGGGVFRFEGGE